MCSVVFVFLESALSALHTLALDTLCIIQQEDSNTHALHTILPQIPSYSTRQKIMHKVVEKLVYIYRKMRYGKSVF